MIDRVRAHYEASNYKPEILEFLKKYPGCRRREDETSDEYGKRMLAMNVRGIEKLEEKNKKIKEKITKPITYKINNRDTTLDVNQEPVSIEGTDKDPFWINFSCQR